MALALPIRFNFSAGTDVPGYTTVRRSHLYTAALGYGYDSAFSFGKMAERKGNGINPDDRLDEAHSKILVNTREFFRVDVPKQGEYAFIAWIGDPLFTVSNTHHAISMHSGFRQVPLSLAENVPANTFIIRSVQDRMLPGEYIWLQLGIIMGAPRSSALAYVHIDKSEGIKATLESLNADATKRIP